VIPWLEANVVKTPEQQRRMEQDPRAHWFTVVFDREGYSPELFQHLWQKRIAILTYRKFAQDRWPEEEFTSGPVRLAGGETVTMNLAKRARSCPTSFGCVRSVSSATADTRLRF
jgi:hypothetical protein